MLDYNPPLSWWANDIRDNKGGKEIHPREFIINKKNKKGLPLRNCNPNTNVWSPLKPKALSAVPTEIPP